MTRRFSSEELRFLRNRVPIGQVIETLIGLACQKRNGKLSFSCPICGGFDTSINAIDNFARCAACRQKFNPIEFVMHQLKIDFVESVKWLKKRAPGVPTHQNPSTSRSKKPLPTAIGDILPGMMSTLADRKTDAQSLESIVQRISRLEHQLRHLHRTVNELQSSLNR
jgi:hypothetical protein